MLSLAAYDYKLGFRKTSERCNGDRLSRLPDKAEETPDIDLLVKSMQDSLVK